MRAFFKLCETKCSERSWAVKQAGFDEHSGHIHLHWKEPCSYKTAMSWIVAARGDFVFPNGFEVHASAHSKHTGRRTAATAPGQLADAASGPSKSLPAAELVQSAGKRLCRRPRQRQHRGSLQRRQVPGQPLRVPRCFDLKEMLVLMALACGRRRFTSAGLS